MLAISGATGKLGTSTLAAITKYNLIPPSEILCTTSSNNPQSTKWTALERQGHVVRHASFDDPASFEQALEGCDRLFLISSPRIERDFGDAKQWEGREGDHKVAIDAAIRAGVRRIYYASLAFAWGTDGDGNAGGHRSKAGVMQAHLRTEQYLKELGVQGVITWTVLRQGLYNESWPLYLGYWDLAGDDERREVHVAGDGRIAWTSIADLGVGNAVVLAAHPEEWENKVVYLSSGRSRRTLGDIASVVSKVKGRDVRLKVVRRDAYERFYVDERGMDEGQVRWWAKTYDALMDEECDVQDGTLDAILKEKGVTPKAVEETVKDMLLLGVSHVVRSL